MRAELEQYNILLEYGAKLELSRLYSYSLPQAIDITLSREAWYGKLTEVTAVEIESVDRKFITL